MKKLSFIVFIVLISMSLTACNLTNSSTTTNIPSTISTEDSSTTVTESNSATITTETTTNTSGESTTTESSAETTTQTTIEEQIITFLVEFDSMGGSIISDMEVNEGDYLTLPEPNREGYIFLGWYDESGNAFLETDAVTSDLILYAYWEIDDNQYYEDYIDLSSVHYLSDNSDIEVSGVVYYMTQNGYYIQDNTANLFVFTDQEAPTVELGSRVVVSGDVATYREVKQLVNPTLVETNAYERDVFQEKHEFQFGVTELIPGRVYTITGEVRIEGGYNTAYLYEGNQKVAEIYYKSLAKSVDAIKAYEGEMVTVDLLYYAVGDEVQRYAFQGNTSHIKLAEISDFEAINKDAQTLPSEKTLFADYDFGQGFYGSSYEVIYISNQLVDYIELEGNNLLVTRPLETESDAFGYITVRVSLNEEVAIDKNIDITVKSVGSGTSDLAYYDSADGLTGWDLYYELNSIINNGFKQLSYDDAKWVLEESDRDPSNPNNVILVYTRESVQGEWNYPNWNREHTWPKSKLTSSGQKADVHNLKPSDVDENSRRGNLPFGYMSGSGVYEPHDDVKGDVARIVFYMATMYSNLNINLLGDLDMLIDWHFLDPVDDFERNRNEVIYSYQKNRNPYIDNPDYVELVWEAIG
jgi:uncharacterized repeat protein (TIGR02543 family)